MRFIWNFFFFGILFYLIWMFFPDAFQTLVGWANNIVVFLHDFIVTTWEKIRHTASPIPGPGQPNTLAWFLVPLFKSIGK